MKAGRLFGIAVAGAVLIGAASPHAVAGPDESIKARQTLMKARGEALGPLVAIMKGEAPYDAAAVKSSLEAMNAAWEAAKNADPFSPESAKGTIETWAKPEIWSDPDGFKAAGQAFGRAVAGLAASTDEASFKAAFVELGNSCKGCHDKFRRPKEQ